MDDKSYEPGKLVAALARDRVALDLKTVDICFLAGLSLRAKRQALASFDEEILFDMFEQACEVAEPGAENPRKRATHTIQRLRDQRMLARVDGAGIVRSGEYALTRLAASIVDYFLAEERLTRESLTLLTGTLRLQLAEILMEAKKAGGKDAFRRKVVGPLRITVGDLVGGIERRQRGLDLQQEEVQSEIAGLLQADWFGAIDRCQTLLETTTDTLKELNEILLKDTHHFTMLLQEIQSIALSVANAEAEEAVQRVIEHVDSIASWGAARQRAWSDYYQYVHRYLRDVIRLDPDRALSQRLRDQITVWEKGPFFLLAANAPSIRLLRTTEIRIEHPSVTRPAADRDISPSVVALEDIIGIIELQVNSAIADGLISLSDVTSKVLSTLPTSTHFIATGRIAEILPRMIRVWSELERPWKPIQDRLEIEEWKLISGGGTP